MSSIRNTHSGLPEADENTTQVVPQASLAGDSFSTSFVRTAQAGQPGQADQPDQAKQHDAPRHPKNQRRITRMVGSSIGLLGIFLLAVCTVSWFGLRSFQSQLSVIATTSLPKVMETSTASSRLSKLVLSAERVVSVETEAERRITQRNIQKELEDIRASFDADAAGNVNRDDHALSQLHSLSGHLDRLNLMVEERLQREARLRQLLVEMDAASLHLAVLPFTPGLNAEEQQRIAEATSGLQRFLTESRRKAVSGQTLNPMQLQRDASRTLAVVQKILEEGKAGTPDDLFTTSAQLRDIFFAEDGFIATVRNITRLRSELHSTLGITRSVMADLAASRVTTFNEMINESSRIVSTTTDQLGMFTRFFLAIALFGLLLSLGVYLYFRKSFIIRLENLNRAVQDGVHGEWEDVDSSGSDEIATIADSVNHFARELKISTQLAESSNQAKSSFLANMSHEIRTPMNAVIGFTRMVAETELTSAQRNYVTKIESSAHFLLSIINDILDFSKIEAGKLEVETVPFELRTIIDNVASACETKARAKDLRLEVFVDESLPRLLTGDPVRIFQVLNNLCDNAVKFTERGLVSLAVTREETLADTYMVNFRVDDQGVGLTPAQMDKLFRPFTQADTSTTRRFGGTGLGLTISKSLCELMGGSIGVTSEFGRGSTFFFTLPLGKTAQFPRDPETAKSEQPPLNLGAARLLVVEDNMINQEIILALLEKTAAHVELADNGQIAVEKAAHTHYDLILMDIQMPVMDGIEATRAIRALPPDSPNVGVPIIAMTAHAMNEDIKKCLDAGMNDHVAKPIEPELLFGALRNWL